MDLYGPKENLDYICKHFPVLMKQLPFIGLNVILTFQIQFSLTETFLPLIHS